jgi:uncharacterized protein
MIRRSAHGPSASGAPASTKQRWVWSQRWFDMLFLHWRVPADVLRGHVSPELTIDEFAGDAWVSLVLFKLDVRPMWLPFLPGFSGMVEVNLRTYVRFRDQSGITFLSVHASNRLAIFLARRLTPMPYRWAMMSYEKRGREFQFDAAGRMADRFGMTLRFRPNSPPRTTRDDTLESWLLERYRLFLPDGRRRLLYADVSHPRWHIQETDVSLTANTAGSQFGLHLDRSAELAHFSNGVDARFGTFRMATA